MNKIILIEDDRDLGHQLQQFLRREGLDVTWVTSIAEARIYLKQFHYQLALLDWMLPDGQGIDLLREIRQTPEGIKMAILMLTARSDLVDKIIGLESGADDYITKPFEPRELTARIRVQLRKGESARQGLGSLGEQERPKVLDFGKLMLDQGLREVTFQTQSVHLTKMEFDLLFLLAENPGKPFTREELLNRVWGFEFTPTTRTVDTHILQLRQKFGDDVIETVRGVGYRFNKHYGKTPC